MILAKISHDSLAKNRTAKTTVTPGGVLLPQKSYVHKGQPRLYVTNILTFRPLLQGSVIHMITAKRLKI